MIKEGANHGKRIQPIRKYLCIPPGNCFHRISCRTGNVWGGRLDSKKSCRGLANVIVKDPTLGVDVAYNSGLIEINLYIIIEYGTRITSVANSVAHNIRFKVEKAMGLPADHVLINVHVRGLRISNPD